MTEQAVPERAEVVVIGAGVIGLAVAYELLRRGRRVLVLERDAPGAGASHIAGGMLAPTSEADLEAEGLIDFALDSLRRYPDFVAQLEATTSLYCGFRTEGTLWVARNRDEEEELDHLWAIQQARSLSSRRLSAEEVFAREPHLSGRVLGGLLVEDDLQVEPRALVRCLEAAVNARGGKVLSGCAVREVGASGGRVEAVSGSGPTGEPFSVRCEAAVLAAGAWSSTDITTPVAELRVRPVKGQIVRLRGPHLIDHVIRSPEVYLVPRLDGEIAVGATMEEQGFDSAPTAGAVLDLLRSAWEVLPGIYDLRVAELSVGLRPAVRDHLPVIGASETDGLFVATGHFRSGVLLAPATAHYLAESIVSGRVSPELAPFALSRLRRAGRASVRI